MDGNWLAFSFYDLEKNDGQIPPAIFQLIKVFIDQSVNVVFVVDGESRHHSKVATQQRSADKQQARLEAWLMRLKLMTLIQSSRNAGLPKNEADSVENEITTMESEIKNRERNLSPRLPAEFVHLMREKCAQLQDGFKLIPGKGTLTFVQAESKLSGYIRRGTTQHKDINRFCDVWLAWSWQTNFMFKPVL